MYVSSLGVRDFAVLSSAKIVLVTPFFYDLSVQEPRWTPKNRPLIDT